MSGQRHPDTEQIASLAAGPIGGFRARRFRAHIAGCDRCAAVSDQLGAMRSMLASVPSAALPDDFERQISAAIATEAAARATAVVEATPAGAQQDRDSAEPVREPPRRGPARSRSERGFRLRPAMAFIPVVACLLVAFGYLASRPGPSTFSGSYSGAAGSAREPLSAAASSSASAPFRNAGAGSKAEPAPNSAFSVTASGTRYLASTLRTQLRDEIKSLSSFDTFLPSAAPTAAPTATPSPDHSIAASTSTAGAPASRSLIGCVLQLTGGIRPEIVDKAFYQDRPVYVIAVPGKAWVVGRGCTAGDTELITSASLSGTP